jgi:hypothetical protein
MNALWKGRKRKMETKISAVRVKEKPKYDTLAAELLERCRGFYEDPENEKAYQEWLKEKKDR